MSTHSLIRIEYYSITMTLNPNRARDTINKYVGASDDDRVKMFPKFFTKVKLDTFRHVKGLSMDFIHPITVISGSNCSGKTSVLMTIACSHYNFDRQDVANGEWKRATWSSLVRFTNHDTQLVDWEYHVGFREGTVPHFVKGFRRYNTKKWGGAGKKEGQIGKPTKGHPEGGRHVCLIDLNRINPGRHLTMSAYNKARKAAAENLENQDSINEYLSYILEFNYDVRKLTESADNNVYKFSAGSEKEYSSFNTASGEDVLINLLTQILHIPNYSLILIDELEIGLHPKIQRRLMDVIYMIANEQHKQFIITSHSYAIIDSVSKESRLFIENKGGACKCLPGLSTYETLTRMDCVAFPVSIIYVEDEISKWIIDKALEKINTESPGFSRLVKPIKVGSADKTFQYFKTRQELNDRESLFAKPACILDGDMRNKKSTDGVNKYPAEENLFFHYSEDAPEKMLLNLYLKSHLDGNLQYHLKHSNPHCLLQKMVDNGVATDKTNAFNLCFAEYIADSEGYAHYTELINFLIRLV